MRESLDYLLEMRKRLISSVLFVFLVFCGFSFLANDFYAFLAAPLLNQMTSGSLIATSIVAPFLAPFKLAFILSVLVSMPFLLYQAWSFVAPALYEKERRVVWPLLFASVILFYAGVSFAYFIVFPLVFKFFIHTAPVGVEVKPDISQYLDFALQLFFAFGAAFEVPIVTFVLIWLGVFSREQLASMRPYIIVFAFVLGMVLTPPDVISQIMLAIPIWILFELGLFFAKLFLPIRDCVGAELSQP